MRYFLLLFVLITSLFSADVNKKLFSENNASQEIQKIRLEVANNISTDPEEQNKISIQKLFLSKIETLATSLPKGEMAVYKLPKKDKLTEKEFLKYFDALSLTLSKMQKRKNNVAILKERLSTIKDELEKLPPDKKDKIRQGQLEYAYFKWKDIYNERALKRYKKYLMKEKVQFLSAFEKVEINDKRLKDRSNKQNLTLQKLYQKKVYLELQLEKETIALASKTKLEENSDLNSTKLLTELDDKQKNWKFKLVQNELKKLNEQISKQIKAKNDILVLGQIKNLREKNLDNYIIYRDIMESFSHDLSANDKEMFILEQKMLEWLKYQYIDNMTAFFYDFQSWFDKVYSQFKVFIDTPLFYQNDKPVVFADFLKMFLTIILGFMLAKFYKRRVTAAQKRIGFIQKQSFKVIGNIGYYIIVLVTFAISLNNIGLDLSSLSLVAGALSVGVGFGLKEVVGNFVSGIILMVERSVKIGDFVEIGNEVSGNVIDIRMRSVTIKTSSNVDVVVPNSSLVQDSFVNYTLEEPVRRLSVPFSVAYGVSYEEVNETIMKALNESELNFVRDSKEFENEVIMADLGDNAVEYKLFVFVRTFGPNARSSFFRLIYKALNENNIPIPFPQLDVRMKTI